MTTPERALDEARAAVARKRATGEYPGPVTGDDGPSERPSVDLLSEWAVIEVDPARVYSTRRAGAPITALKRTLMRLMRQYTIELEAQQSRFNMAMLGYTRDLEQRLEELEHEPPPNSR